jgi:hypothetical protein
VGRAFDGFPLPLVAWPVDELVLDSNDPFTAGMRPGVPGPSFEFAPPRGWAGAIELAPSGAVA